jgi:membrane-associated phospholipid phosphatase
MQRAALLVSGIFHPLAMPLLIVFLAVEFDWYIQGKIIPEQARLVYLIIALSTIAFPGLNILLLRWYGVINSLQMPTRKERNTPYLSTLFFFGLGYYLLRKAQLPTSVYAILIGCAVSLLCIAVINTKWKISAHAVGAGGMVGAFLGLFQIHAYSNMILLCVLVLVAGAVGSARLILGAHTPLQVYAGLFLGAFIVYLSVVMEWFI